MKKILTLFALLVLTVTGAQAQVTATLMEGYGDPLTLDQFKALAGTNGRFGFVAASNSAAATDPRCDHWVGFNSTFNTTTLSEAYLFYLEASGSNYKVKRASDNKYVSISTSSLSFVDTGGFDFALVNADASDGTKAVTGAQSIRFKNPSGNNWYNVKQQKLNSGTGGWSVYAVFGPIYKNIKIDCQENGVSLTGYPQESAYRVGGTINAPGFAGKKLVDGQSTSVTIDEDNMNIVFNYEASSFDYTLAVNNAPEGTTMTIKGENVAIDATNYSNNTAAVVEGDVAVTFPAEYAHYSYTVSIEGTTITVNCKAMTAITDLTNLTDGYYLVEGISNGVTGYFYHDKSLADGRLYRLKAKTSINLDGGEYNETANLKYVWILKNNGDGSFTLRNCGTLNYFVADEYRNQNCTGTATANLVWNIESQWMYQTNYNNGGNILYLHCNKPSGDMNFSYWDGNGSAGGSGSLVAPTFYKVQLSDAAVAQIVATRKADLNALNTIPVGPGLNQYTASQTATDAISDANTVYNNDNATLEQVDNSIAALENLSANDLSLNMPQAGMFLRATSVHDTYLSGVAASNGNLSFTTTADANTIFYFDGNKLLTFGNGLYANGREVAAVGGAGLDYRFEESTITAGKYVLRFDPADGKGERFLYAWGTTGDKTNYADQNTTDDANCAFTLTEVTELPITLSEVNGTYYRTFSAPVDIATITGATMYNVTVAPDNKTASTVDMDAANGLKAGNGVVLIGTSTTATATIGAAQASATTNLKPQYASEPASAHANHYFLGTKTSNSEKVVGFYLLKDTGKTGGFKAYIEKNASTAKEGFDLVFGNEVTGIDAIENGADNGAVFNLQGQRVNKAQKGVYIQNGKKVVLK